MKNTFYEQNSDRSSDRSSSPDIKNIEPIKTNSLIEIKYFLQLAHSCDLKKLIDAKIFTDGSIIAEGRISRRDIESLGIDWGNNSLDTTINDLVSLNSIPNLIEDLKEKYQNFVKNGSEQFEKDKEGNYVIDRAKTEEEGEEMLKLSKHYKDYVKSCENLDNLFTSKSYIKDEEVRLLKKIEDIEKEAKHNNQIAKMILDNQEFTGKLSDTYLSSEARTIIEKKVNKNNQDLLELKHQATLTYKELQSTMAQIIKLSILQKALNEAVAIMKNNGGDLAKEIIDNTNYRINLFDNKNIGKEIYEMGITNMLSNKIPDLINNQEEIEQKLLSNKSSIKTETIKDEGSSVNPFSIRRQTRPISSRKKPSENSNAIENKKNLEDLEVIQFPSPKESELPGLEKSSVNNFKRRLAGGNKVVGNY